MLLAAVGWLFLKGVGIWGINIPVAWGFAIMNFVWWIGIGHAGTLISAILLLLHQEWRDVDQPLRRGDDALRRRLRGAVSRSCTSAGPGCSTGSSPIPTRCACGRSSAARSCGTSSRSRPTRPCRSSSGSSGCCPISRRCATAPDGVRRRSSTASSRWAGAARPRHWHRYETAYLLLAGLATPLVVSVHSVVCLRLRGRDRSRAGTRRSSRRTSSRARSFRLRDGPDARRSRCARSTGSRTSSRCGTSRTWPRCMLATGLIVAYGYAVEALHGVVQRGFRRAVPLEKPRFRALLAGVLGAHSLQRSAVQLLWFRRIRTRPWLLFVHLARHQRRHVARALHDRGRFPARDFLPSIWGSYHGTGWDWATFIGSIGLFLSLLFLFVRFLPVISIAEMRSLVDETEGRE